jgi:hypothetical protein
MNQLGKRIGSVHLVPNNTRVALAMNGTHVVADAPSGAGSHASPRNLILTYLDASRATLAVALEGWLEEGLKFTPMNMSLQRRCMIKYF